MLMRDESRREEQNEIAKQPLSLFHPLRSFCPQCHKTIPWYFNLPLLSFLFLRGRCKFCRAPIPLSYFFIESMSLATGLIIFTIYGKNFQSYGLQGLGPEGYGLMLLGWALLTLACIDLKFYILPDQITIPFLWLGLLLNVFELYVPADQAIFGAAMGYVSLWAVYWLYFLLRKKEGLGFGDFKLLALAGAWGGWALILPSLLLASLAALVCNLPMLIKKQYQQPIPFGPYLALAIWLLLVFPEWQHYFYTLRE